MDIALNIDILQCIIVIAGYIITVSTSGLIVRHFVGTNKNLSSKDPEKSISTRIDYDVGTIIGKCENILTLTFILAGAFTGLALIFTAKSIVRREHIKRNPKYYLGGTLVNFSYSVIMGFMVRTALRAFGYSF